jgi:hypothetical protein
MVSCPSPRRPATPPPRRPVRPWPPSALAYRGTLPGMPPAEGDDVLGSNRGVWPASLIMFALSLLLGWIPFIGPAIAGFVGGMQAGTTGSAILAALIPSLLLTAFVWLLGVVLDLAIIATFLGIGLFMILLIGALPLVLGAWIGGYIAEGRRTSGRV